MKRIILFLLLILPAGVFAGEPAMLANGTRFISIPRDFTKTVSLVLFVRGGITRETAANNGIGLLTNRIALKSNPLLPQLEFFGGSVSASVAGDYVEFSLSTPSEHIDDILPLLKAYLFTPQFDQAIFDREQALLLNEIESLPDNPNHLAANGFAKASYGDFPYALPTEGTKESISALDLAQIKAYFSSLFQGKNIIAVLAGSYSPEQEKAVKAILGGLPAGEPFALSCDGSGMGDAVRVVEANPRIKQAKLYIGYEAPAANSDLYPALKVATDLLGSGMSSRYFTELRKNRGYAYSVGAGYPSRLCSSRFMAYIGLDAANVEPAIEEIHRINTTFFNDVTEEELEKVKNHMVGQVLIYSQTNSRVAWHAAFFENVGLGADYFDDYVERLKNIHVADLKKAAAIFEKPKAVYILTP